MSFFSQKKSPALHPDVARETALAHERVREHWTTCPSCRGAASASASLWCAQGLDLMRRGIADHAHWDTCARCREAQERVRSAQCDVGRELEESYRVLVRRLAGA